VRHHEDCARCNPSKESTVEREYDLGRLANLPCDRPYKGTETRLHGLSYIEFKLPNIVGTIFVPTNAVKIWLPEEPGMGSVVIAADGKAWQRDRDGWRQGITVCTWEVLNKTEGPLNLVYDQRA
jgi:hypothetical protein